MFYVYIFNDVQRLKWAHLTAYNENITLYLIIITTIYLIRKGEKTRNFTGKIVAIQKYIDATRLTLWCGLDGVSACSREDADCLSNKESYAFKIDVKINEATLNS